MNSLPAYIFLLFSLALLPCIYFFYKAAGYSRSFLLLICTWIVIQSAVSLTGFYTVSNSTPPRFAGLIAPPVLLMIFLFSTRKGRAFISKLDIKTLTLLHSIRIPVELVLLLLFTQHVVPQVMTFEGRNFDIISGITAPVMYYLVFYKKWLNQKILLAWNLICLGLLLNIVIHAILSVPTPFQQLAFDQPNIAVLYFPFILLPSVIVPLVLFSHLVSVRQLLSKQTL